MTREEMRVELLRIAAMQGAADVVAAARVYEAYVVEGSLANFNRPRDTTAVGLKNIIGNPV